MRFVVSSTFRAECDVAKIYSWLEGSSKRGADSWFRALQRARLWLEENALLCSFAPENNLFDVELREHFFKTKHGNKYRLLFTVDGSEVRVLHVRGPGQDLVSPNG